jgi:4-amino-4-deoxy-L-arabinose transferase-like glycosyltransferase
MISQEIDIAIVAAIFIIGFVLSFKSLKWGLFYVLTLVPLMHKELFSFVVWDLLPIRIAILSLSLVAAFRLFGWIRKNGWKKLNTEVVNFVKTDPFLILMLALWVIRGLSIFKSEEQDYSLALFAFYSIIISFYVVYKQQLLTFGEGFYRKFLHAYIAIAWLTGIFAVVQYYLRSCCRYSIGGVWVVPGNPPRLGSTFWDVNHYGGFLITVIPILFAYIFAAKKTYWKIVSAIGVCFMGILLFSTQSRSAWIGLSVGMIFSFIIYYWNHLRKPLLITLVVVLLGVAAFFGYTTYKGISVRDKIANYMHYRLDSTDTHFMLLQGSAEVFFSNMLVGSGYGGFDPAFRKTETATEYFDREPKLRDLKVPPHSVWGEVLGETGGLGIVIYASFAILIVASLITTIFKSKKSDLKYLGTGLLGSVIALFAGGLFYSYNIEFYWFTLFLAIGYIFINFDSNYNFEYVLNFWYKARITPYLIIVPMALFYFFLNLGATTLIDWDEAIYAKVARNIVESGDWLTLHWQDMNEFWFEKPPLYMWMTALVFKVTNFNAFGARLVSTMFGILGIILIYKFGQRLYSKLTGIFAALILISTAHYLYYSRNGMLDVTATVFIVATIYFMYWAFNTQKNAMWIAAIGGLILGLGVMTKAVIGLLPVPIIGLYYLYLVFVEKRKLSFKIFLPFIFVSLLVSLPWHIYSYAVHGQEFLHAYFLEHMLGRGLEGLGHEMPLWWYLDVVKTSFRIWLFPFAAGIVSLFFIDKKRRGEYVLLTLSVVIIFAFFSLSKDKLQWYIMPIYPFMALIAARFIDRFIYIVNVNLKTDARFNPIYLRSLALFVMFIISAFYVVIIRDKVYYPDFNKDKVALVQIFNDTYPRDLYPERKLYYVNVAPPVLLFYSEHKIKAIKEEEILSLIEEADPNENRDFLVPSSIYYSVNDDQAEITAPLVLDVKGSAGEWVLMKSLSRVDVLRRRYSELQFALQGIRAKQLLKQPLTAIERINLRILEPEETQVIKQLTDYGYPPEN